MGRFIKIIPISFIWLAGLILTAHLIIPHDHHVNYPFTAQDSQCPVTKNQHDHQTGFPIHCQAFNDLKAEEIVKYFFNDNSHYETADFSSDHRHHESSLECTFLFIDIHNKPFTDLFFLDFFPLRAPPALA
jgi:hypothetical protein